MKREVLVSHVTAAVMAWGLAVCAAGCLVSGFRLDTADMGRIVLLCGIVSALGSFCFYWKRGGLGLLCAGALIGGFVWRDGTAWAEIKALLYCISIRYDSAYGWGVLNIEFPAGSGLGYPLGIVGALAALSVSWTVARRKNVFFAVIPVVLPLIACLVVTDTVPSEGYLFGLLLGVALLLMTDWVRRKGSARDAWLTAALALPMAAALGILFLAVPRDSYVNRTPELQGKLVSWAEQLRDFTQELSGSFSTGTGFSGTERVDLKTLGPRGQWNYSVMKVTAPYSGTVYLRGQDYNTYSGTGWIASENRTETFSAGTGAAETLAIQTYGVKSVLYIPYYPAGEITLTGGCVKNDRRLEEYSFTVASETEQSRATQDAQYWQLPAETLGWARELVDGIAGDQETVQGKAEAIAAFVRNSADYDLNTARMDGDYDDFARWFLEKSGTGYCVHFATAATVLLRAAGIPARYVEGYLVTCRAGEETLVTGKMAHAWAEYDDGGVWRVLEATPAATLQEQETAPEETAAIQPAAETALPAEPAETDAVRPAQTQSQSQSQTQPENTPVPQKRELPGWLKTAARTLLWIALAAAAVWGQSEWRVRRRRAAWNRGQPNRQALARWGQVNRLAWLLKVPVPEELEALAQKARFSQHTLTQEELAQFDDFRRAAWGSTPMSALRKWLLRLIFAVE